MVDFWGWNGCGDVGFVDCYWCNWCLVVGNGDFGVGVNCFVVLYCYWFVVGDMVGEKFVSGENYLFIV